MKHLVIGLGETGNPLWQILSTAYPGDVNYYDSKLDGEIPNGELDFMHICIPYGEKFISYVQSYQIQVKPKLTVIHSTVPIGTTTRVGCAVHSPILGKHGRMLEDLRAYPKWVGGERAEEIARYFNGAGIRTNIVKTSEETEALILMCLAKYGMAIAFSIYQKQVCDKLGILYEDVHLWDTFYNEGVMPSLKRPLIEPPQDEFIGGHCVVPGSRMLNEQFPNVMLFEVLRHDKNAKTRTFSGIPLGVALGE